VAAWVGVAATSARQLSFMLHEGRRQRLGVTQWPRAQCAGARASWLRSEEGAEARGQVSDRERAQGQLRRGPVGAGVVRALYTTVSRCIPLYPAVSRCIPLPIFLHRLVVAEAELGVKAIFPGLFY
jgi:hypothetical protein